MSDSKLDEFTRAYLHCALWTTDDNPGSGEWHEHGAWTIANIHPETLAVMQADCARFQEKYVEDLDANLGRAGHDFWLTRNGHGAGFWDGDWPEEAGNRLTEAAKQFGEFSLYLGDDGRIHGCRG